MSAPVKLGEAVDEFLATLPGGLAAVVRADIEKAPPMSPQLRDYIATTFAGAAQ